MSWSSEDELALKQRLLRCEQDLAALRALLSGWSDGAGVDALLERSLQAADGDALGSEQLSAVWSALREIKTASERAAVLESSLRFRLGSQLVDLARSPRAWMRLPGQVVEATRRASARLFRRGRSALRGRVPGRRHDLAGMSRAAGEATELFPLPPPAPAPAGLRGLRVAAVMDPFSLASFGPECELVPLRPDDWQQTLRRAPPHLLLVESAWTGEQGEWRGQVERAHPHIRSLVASCRAAGIPTVFWNKEDPLHFEAFLPTARLFDHVFTTDALSIPRYVRSLGHRRVGLLAFGLQPRTHHPVSDDGSEREAASVFAGAWYGNLAERCADFERVADALALAGSLVIHDRNAGSAEPHQRYPEKYSRDLRPSVPYADTPALFRRYRIGINLNTIKSSPTMFARRVLELAGCNCSVYGNHSEAMALLFGDLTVCSDDPSVLLDEAWRELRDPNGLPYRQRRLRALRKVLAEHTWSRRLATIASAAMGAAPPVDAQGRLWVLGRARDGGTLERLLRAFNAQRDADAVLLLDLAPGLLLPAGARRLGESEPAPDDWVAAFHPDDEYGPFYLRDLALARQFELGDAIGKGAWYEADLEGVPCLRHPEREYRRVEALALRRGLWRRSRWPGPLSGALDSLDDGVITGDGLVSVDAMNYMAGGAALPGARPMCLQPLLDEGAALSDVEDFVARLPAAADPAKAGAAAISGARLAALFQSGVVPPGTSVGDRDGRAEFCSSLPQGQGASLISSPIMPAALERAGEVALTLQAPSAPQLELFLEPVDRLGRPLAKIVLHRGLQARISPPAGTAAYRLQARAWGPFVRTMDGLWLERPAAEPLVLPGRGRILLVCNGYPEAGRLYRNAFIHRRVLAYRSLGLGVDVVWVSDRERPRTFSFEGVGVHVCGPDAVAATLKVSGHVAVAVHSPDPVLWSAVAEAAQNRRIVAWVHGADIQPWTRRRFNARTDAERAAAEAVSDVRMAFWRELLASPPAGLHLVFVSHAFAREAWSDLGLELPPDRWSVVPNPIDTVLFAYSEKPVAQRLDVLSIRPHASRIYANDLVAATIRILAGQPIFAQLRFTLVGDGPLWDEDFAGLSVFPNVRLRRRFVSQREIAALHRDHGVFLVPTRGDTQGVSRDEAMASGLVPVTCAVGAVPEFVDAASGVLCPPEDPEALAAAIVALAGDPDRFARMSRRAAEHVREISDVALVVHREVALLMEINRKEVAC